MSVLLVTVFSASAFSESVSLNTFNDRMPGAELVSTSSTDFFSVLTITSKNLMILTFYSQKSKVFSNADLHKI